MCSKLMTISKSPQNTEAKNKRWKNYTMVQFGDAREIELICLMRESYLPTRTREL